MTVILEITYQNSVFYLFPVYFCTNVEKSMLFYLVSTLIRELLHFSTIYNKRSIFEGRNSRVMR